NPPNQNKQTQAPGRENYGPDDLNCSNRPVRTRMPGGVGGAEPIGSPLSRFHAILFLIPHAL
ncbi:hypothetical protein EDE05_1021, partial [Neorhizobium sp. R1-B]